MNRGWRCGRMYPARRADRASGAIPGPDFFVRTVPWFHGKRLRDTFHRTMGSIERWQHSGGSRWRRSCHSMNRDRAGRCSASAPTGGPSVRPNIFSDARRAAAISTGATTYGLRITKARCRTRRKMEFSRREGAALFRSVSRVPDSLSGPRLSWRAGR
jgi:hypothetical protein